MDTDFARDTRPFAQIAPALEFDDLVEPPTHRIQFARSFPRGSCGEVSEWTLSPARRIVDFVVAGIALLLFLPVMAIVAAAVRLSSFGPVLFKQERMGQNGCVFTLYKFRSMRLASEQASPITVTGDSRVTGIGTLLRHYKLDELPQFWNVLRGDMSLVGPRPKLPHLEGLHMPCRPGITGAATLAFRFEEKMLSQIPHQYLAAYYEQFVKPSKARIDWDYIRTATWRTDISILWQTVKCCFSSQETKYRVELPEFRESTHVFASQSTRADEKANFRINVI
jgi:lipopolysaccharide/colanic/teichoic acid biosynthesis glycosyltransferase